MTTPISGYQKRKQSVRISYTALLRYLQHYCNYRDRPKAYKKLIADAGVTLTQDPKRVHSFRPLLQSDVRLVLALYYHRYGAKEMRRIRKASRISPHATGQRRYDG